MRTMRIPNYLNPAEKLVGGPVGLPRMLERLGPTFVKIGQFLALRPDLIPQEYCDELMGLFDRVEPFPWTQARAMIVSELGPDIFLTLSFGDFDPAPLAAGSLGQVYRGRLADGTEVAIKVQRPDVEELVRRDLKRARLLVRFAELSATSFMISPREALEEIETWLLQEIDYTRELNNLTRLRDLAGDDLNQKFPRPHPDYCTRKILTTDYIQGISFSDLLRAVRSPADPPNAGIPDGIDLESLARNLVSACLRQIFHYGFFHADLHPGNLIALPGNAIGFVDFGLCGELDPAVRRRQTRYLAAVYLDDAELMYRALIEILIPTDDTDIDAFRREFLEETASWQSARDQAAYLRPHGPRNSPTGQWMISVMRAARHHGLLIPPRILSMYRALLTADSVACRLGTSANMQTLGPQFFESLQKDEVLQSLDPQNLPPHLLSLLSLARNVPGQLDYLLSEMSDNKFVINTTSTESRRTERVRNRRTRIVVSAVVSVGVAILAARPSASSVGGIGMPRIFEVILALLYLFMFFEIRRLR